MNKTLKVKLLNSNAKLPERKTKGASGYDVYLPADVRIPPTQQNPFNKNIRIGSIAAPLGIAVDLPEGCEIQVRPRSGLALKQGIDCHLGTIDSDYKGEISVILYNYTDHPVELKAGERACQLVITRVGVWEVEQVEEIGESERGVGGFGSTGK